MLKTVLCVTGIPAAIALFIPGSVVLGLYLFIIPGVILAIAPTLFLYTAAFAVVRSVLRERAGLRAGIPANAAAAALTLAAGFALPLPATIAGRSAVAAATNENVSSPQTVRLEGDVRLEWIGRAFALRSRRNECDAVCAALLDTAGVGSVTIAGSDLSGKLVTPVTYRLLPKSQAADATLMPADPAGIVDHLPEPDRGTTSGGSHWKEAVAARKALKDSVTAKWSLRLARAESLVAGPPATAFDRAIAIRDEAAHGFHRIGITAVEIADGSGKILLRQQRVTAAVVAPPLHLTPAGPMMDRGFEIGRSTVHTGPRYYDFKPLETLFRETNLARPSTDDRAVPDLRETLETTAPAPAAVVAAWLSTLDWRNLTDRDIDLLAKLIADPATKGLERLYGGYASEVSPRLRRPIAVRLLDPSTDDSLRSTLDTLVRRMPDGTYAKLLPEEEAVLRDRALRLGSSALVARLSDQGAVAVPMLLQLLTEDVRVEPWAKRRRMLADIRRAFSRLGPEASSALPTIERLFELPRSPLTNSSDDAEAWRVAMVRMGKPVETLTFPSHLGADIIARDRERIRRQAGKGPER